MSGIFTKVRSLPINYPLVRGMVSYAIIWPTCSVVQEYIEHGTKFEDADMARAARFGVFGAFFMAPVFYGWMKYTSRFFKSKSLKTAVIRAAIEQVSYSPLAMAYFFFGMSVLEFKPVSTCVNEVREKFWPTYKIGVVFWPTAQTLNFYFISEKNRIVFVSAASFVWTVYLAHMKAKEQDNFDKLETSLDASDVIQSPHKDKILEGVDKSFVSGTEVANVNEITTKEDRDKLVSSTEMINEVTENPHIILEDFNMTSGAEVASNKIESMKVDGVVVETSSEESSFVEDDAADMR